MDIYKLNKKELKTVEKEFQNTIYGQRIRLQRWISITFLVLWFLFAIIPVVCMLCCGCCGGSYACNISSTTATILLATYVISLPLNIMLCIFTETTNNKELRKYIDHKNKEENNN